MRIVLAFVLMLAAGGAAAQGYVFGGLGALKDSDTALAFAGGAGYQVNRYLAAELGYLDAGEVANTPASSTDARGARLSLVGMVPLGKASLVGMVGAYQMRGSLTTATDMRTASGTVGAVGLGVAYALSDRLQVRALLEQTRADGDFFGPGLELPRIRWGTLGLVYRF